jgi:hypothetical protein
MLVAAAMSLAAYAQSGTPEATKGSEGDQNYIPAGADLAKE